MELLRCRTASGLATLIPANACQHIVVTHGCRRGGLQGTRGAGGAAALPQGAPLCAAAGLGQHHRLHHAALLCAAAHHPARTCLSTFFSKILCMLQGFKGHWQMPLPSSRRATPRCRASSGAHITPPNPTFGHPPPPPRARARAAPFPITRLGYWFAYTLRSLHTACQGSLRCKQCVSSPSGTSVLRLPIRREVRRAIRLCAGHRFSLTI